MATATENAPVQGDLIIESADGLMAQTRAELDALAARARAYPRSIKEFKDTALELACLDEDTAASMFYVLRRGDKRIEGPSIRLAEVVAYSWRNLHYESRIVAIDEKFVTAQGTCFDLERNSAARGECKRRITDRNGRRYNDDMIQTTCNAAAAIAVREAIFKIVPRSMFHDIFQAARETSIGAAISIKERRQKAVEWFQSVGAGEEQILEWLGVASLDEITQDDLIDLRGIVTAIKDGVTTVEEAFKTKESKRHKRARVSALSTSAADAGQHQAAKGQQTKTSEQQAS